MIAIIVLCAQRLPANQPDNSDHLITININHNNKTSSLSFDDMECLETADSIAITTSLPEKQSAISEWSQKIAIKLFFLVEDHCSYVYNKCKPLLKVLTNWRKKIL